MITQHELYLLAWDFTKERNMSGFNKIIELGLNLNQLNPEATVSRTYGNILMGNALIKGWSRLKGPYLNEIFVQRLVELGVTETSSYLYNYYPPYYEENSTALKLARKYNIRVYRDT